jgi:hypothetical protein
MVQTSTNPHHTAVIGYVSIVLFTLIYLNATPWNISFPGKFISAHESSTDDWFMCSFLCAHQSSVIQIIIITYYV